MQQISIAVTDIPMDTFTGAYASEVARQSAMQEELNIEKAVVRACRASALIVSALGAQDGIPWANEIDEFAVSSDAPQIANLGIGGEGEMLAT